MAKLVSTFELPFGPRSAQTTLTSWLHHELSRAILDGRLKAGTRLPATRDFAQQYSISRGIVVEVFERLQAEGFLRGRVGAGTWVNEHLPDFSNGNRRPESPPTRVLPPPLTGLTYPQPARPFRCHEPALKSFPSEIWARIAARRLRRISVADLAGRDPRGYEPLRDAIAEYLGSSRGVNCSVEQIVIVSGAQQGLDLLARLLLQPGESIWMEDPGYFGATIALRNSGAKMVPVPVDAQGLSVDIGRRLAPRARGAYLTPAHQFPLGVTMSMERRLAILSWAHEEGAFLIEDDYDSEYRFEGPPLPALKSLDRNGSVILVGTFNKTLFPALRLGYLVIPEAMVDPLLALRFGIDQNSVGLDQAILTDFITDGHMGRHMRRMREVYGCRLLALQEASRKHLTGLLEVSRVQAGLYTMGLLLNGVSSRHAEVAAAARGVETMALDRFMLKRRDIQGILLGFAAFDEIEIRNGVADLAAALESHLKTHSRLG